MHGQGATLRFYNSNCGINVRRATWYHKSYSPGYSESRAISEKPLRKQDEHAVHEFYMSAYWSLSLTTHHRRVRRSLARGSGLLKCMQNSTATLKYGDSVRMTSYPPYSYLFVSR
jgi:hypothetical protein